MQPTLSKQVDVRHASINTGSRLHKSTFYRKEIKLGKVRMKGKWEVTLQEKFLTEILLYKNINIYSLRFCMGVMLCPF